MKNLVESIDQISGQGQNLTVEEMIALKLHQSKMTLEYQYTKYLFKKTVKRMCEDESTLWYDQVEEIQAEFKEIKEIYDCI